jgi:hypothetical protein
VRRSCLETFPATFRAQHGKSLPRYVEQELRRYLSADERANRDTSSAKIAPIWPGTSEQVRAVVRARKAAREAGRA